MESLGLPGSVRSVLGVQRVGLRLAEGGGEEQAPARATGIRHREAEGDRGALLRDEHLGAGRCGMDVFSYA